LLAAPTLAAKAAASVVDDSTASPNQTSPSTPIQAIAKSNGLKLLSFLLI
jgi:hypothetical protein